MGGLEVLWSGPTSCSLPASWPTRKWESSLDSCCSSQTAGCDIRCRCSCPSLVHLVSFLFQPFYISYPHWDGLTTVTCSSWLQNELKKTSIAYKLSSHRYPVIPTESGLHRVSQLWGKSICCSDFVLGNVWRLTERRQVAGGRQGHLPSAGRSWFTFLSTSFYLVVPIWSLSQGLCPYNSLPALSVSYWDSYDRIFSPFSIF